LIKSSHEKLQNTAAVTKWRRVAEHDYFPLYRAGPTRIPILHFVMGEGQERVWGKSVLAWREKTSGKVVVVPLPGSHHSLFRETNLEVITNAIEDWLTVTLAAEADPAAV
jgi:surfactin synthase thioesterase subunit